MMPRYIQPVSINIDLAQSHSPPSCIAGPLTCSRDRRCSPFRRTASRNEQPETSSPQRITSHEHLSHDLVDYRGHPGRFRGIAAAVTVQTDVLVSAVIAAMLIGGGSPWLRPITRRTTPPPRTLLTIALRDGATWAAGMVTVIGLITLAGAPALPLILLMAITSAPVCRYLRDRVEFTPSLPCSKDPLIRTGGVDVPLLPLPDCSQLSDEALCRCWRMSFPALQSDPSTSPSATDALHLARTREAYLDEIERRDPRGFARWLESGARAGSDPAKFLTPRDHPPPPQP